MHASRRPSDVDSLLICTYTPRKAETRMFFARFPTNTVSTRSYATPAHSVLLFVYVITCSRLPPSNYKIRMIALHSGKM